MLYKKLSREQFQFAKHPAIFLKGANIMNIQDLIAKANPQMLSQALGKISSSLTPEQLSQAEAAIKSFNSPQSSMNNLNAEQLIAQLKNNPELIKQLSKNPELLTKLQSIIKK